MKIECPVCKAELIHKRVDDGCDVWLIKKNSAKKFITSKSDGYDKVYCSKNANHKIPSVLEDRVIEIL